ncbi:acetylxylan esterase [Subtercola boreus]|uniref:Acetylxylan esterase n=1 Tax=Subtercola boreus TaxID=120213 RepID=A0A3E0W8V9_9MICO|nr:acetylxylan esterase [Subtercola boreus]RFA17546.1 acetylxylan esterase [Subtercola boreus]RFA17614.1 acetylxylan esterase [Subtercola boreus]RFA24392.1 acetylxylan esterase [Subtercola boreus]
MSRFDFGIDRLRSYRPTLSIPTDFDAFWSDTLAESRSVARPVIATPYESFLPNFEVLDVEFSGFGGHPVKAWFLAPAGAIEPLPTVIEYNGYGGGRGLPHERLTWAAAGYAYLLMDTRGQGSSWGSGGSTPDPVGSGPATPGFMTRGIENHYSYYYRRVITDAVLAVDAVLQLASVDPHRLAVTGGSQGGGLALAVAGLREDLRAVMPDVPFLCHFERAVGLTDSDPYNEIVRYLSVHRDLTEQTFNTLSYFDGVNFAARSHPPALFSVGLMDPVCAPSTVFAAHNNYAGESAIEIYPFNEHEGGQGQHWRKQARWLATHL